MPFYQPPKSRYILAAIAGAALISIIYAPAGASPRDSRSDKVTSLEFYGARFMVAGKLPDYAITSYKPAVDPDTLFATSGAFGFEYAEHIGKMSLASGLEFGKLRTKVGINDVLGAADTTAVSVSYLDIPITYRINAFEPRSANWNLAVGISLPIMFDIINTTEPVFANGADNSSSGAGDKHVDLGLGFGGDIGVERRIANDFFLTARLRYRAPFTGSTRPTQGFVQVGLRVYEF